MICNRLEIPCCFDHFDAVSRVYSGLCFFQTIDVKNVFNVFFQTFLFAKNVGKVQSGKQINKKHFQITATKLNGFINNRILYPVIRKLEC